MVSGPGIDCCLWEEYEQRVSGFEMELFDISCSIATIEDAKELPNGKSWISNAIFSIGPKICKLFYSATESSIMPVRERIRLPKITVPTFVGHILPGAHEPKECVISKDMCWYFFLHDCDHLGTACGRVQTLPIGC